MSRPGTNANVPQIPQPVADIGALVVVAQALKQGMDSMAGYRGSESGRAVTFDDLIAYGLLDANGLTAAPAPTGAPTSLAAETTARLLAEMGLASGIADETTRATAAESAETTRATAAESTNATAIAIETAARIVSDTAEISARVAADTAEAAARTTAIATAIAALPLNRGTVAATSTATVVATGLQSAVVNMGTVATVLDINSGTVGQKLQLEIKQGATAHLVSLGTTVVLGSTVASFTATNTAAARDILQLTCLDGTHWGVLSVAAGFTI